MYILKITFQSFQKTNQLKRKIIIVKRNSRLKRSPIFKMFQTKTKKKIFTLLKSPHVNKKSREHFIYYKYSPKIKMKFKTIFQLLNFLILIKKYLSENLLLKVKIIKIN